MKKGFICILTAILVLFLPLSAWAQNYFDDMAFYKWAQKSVDSLYENKILSGTGYRRFSPGKTVLRADFMIMLVNVFRLTGTPQSNFPDVPPQSYYAEAVGLGKDYGFIPSSDLFYPLKNMNRQDMFTIVANACVKMGLLENTVNEKVLEQFGDERQIAPQARAGIALLVDNRIISGHDGQIFPRQDVSRAEAAVLLHQISSYVEAGRGPAEPTEADQKIYTLNIISLYDNSPSRVSSLFDRKASITLKNGRSVATIRIKRDAREVEDFRISYNLGKDYISPDRILQREAFDYTFPVKNFDVPIYGSLYLVSQQSTVKFRIIFSR